MIYLLMAEVEDKLKFVQIYSVIDVHNYVVCRQNSTVRNIALYSEVREKRNFAKGIVGVVQIGTVPIVSDS